MQLVEKHSIKRGGEYYAEVDNMAFLCKNLYNATLYQVRKHFFETKKLIKYTELQKQFQETNQSDYRALPSKVSQWVMKMVDKNFKSFFKALREYKVAPIKFTGRPKLPKYLDKTNGRFLITFTNQAISKRILDNSGVIKPSGLNIYIPTKLKFNDIQQVRMVRSCNCYNVEVIYTIPDKKLLDDNSRYAAIDIGIDNLATVVSNVSDIKPYAISGKKLKSINHKYNKDKAALQSILEKRNKGKKSKRIDSLTQRRNNRINDYMHKASQYIVNQLVVSGINTLIVGKNDGWKQDINIGKVNNQNFTEIPHAKFIQMLRYKCQMRGINMVTQEESYTSKCSFIDNEEICKHETYMGRRVYRGLFKAKNGKYLNADVNGAYNILRKCKPNAFDSNGVMGVVVHPVIIKITN